MSKLISRREVLRNLLCASTAAPVVPDTKSTRRPILIAGRPVEIAIASISSHTVRISLLPTDEISGPIQYDASLIREALPNPRARLKTLAPVETPLQRRIEVRIVSENARRQIVFDGRPVELRF